MVNKLNFLKEIEKFFLDRPYDGSVKRVDSEGKEHLIGVINDTFPSQLIANAIDIIERPSRYILNIDQPNMERALHRIPDDYHIETRINNIPEEYKTFLRDFKF